jgi:hypothetical protein
MKANLVPVYFQDEKDPGFVKQVDVLKDLLKDTAELSTPVKLGDPVPDSADAVVFPQMLGEAYRHVEDFQKLPQPILVITSEFGTVSMWDWEINSFLGSYGVKVIAPANLESTLKACKAIALKKQLKQSKLLVYQDNPGEGFQAEIFKRFYWWEDECIQSLEKKFGVQVVKKSFEALGAYAQSLSDEAARQVWAKWEERIPVADLSERQILSAVKVYMALKEELDQDPDIIAAGINCLNESHFSDTTPCLAWNMLYEERNLAWGCEADLVVMLTEVLLDKALGVPFMMTNLYPFLMGMAALKHENIPHFPEVDSEFENHILTAHCGYLGVVPQSFSTEWTLRKKVLAIVNDNATAIDARMAEGEMTLVKLVPPFDKLSVIEGQITKYAQFTNSDCLNGAVLKVPNGKRMMNELASHHYILTNGHNLSDLDMLAKVFDMEVAVID